MNEEQWVVALALGGTGGALLATPLAIWSLEIGASVGLIAIACLLSLIGIAAHELIVHAFP